MASETTTPSERHMAATTWPAVLGQRRTTTRLANVAVLATYSPSNRPQATPVWFELQGDHILINTSKGRAKLRNMQAHARVALAIVDRENPYRYVQIQGTVVAFDAENGARDIDRLSQRYTGKAYAYPGADRPANRVSIHIRPGRVSAMGL
jgi:PPOX class probable F420-dependent enzyme